MPAAPDREQHNATPAEVSSMAPGVRATCPITELDEHARNCLRLQYHLPVPGVRNTGEEIAEAREQARLAFQSSVSNPMLITSAGGQALDWQAARVLAYFDLPWSWGEFQQVLGRIRRIGSPHDAVLAIFLKNAGSIDDHTLNILRDKEGLVGETLGLDDQGVLSADRQIVDRLYEAVRNSAQAKGFGAGGSR